MLIRVYFVRHALPDFSIHDDLTRPLSPKGLEDRKKISRFLKEKQVTKVFSSPFKRAIETVSDFANTSRLTIEIIAEFQERKVSNEWIEDFNAFAKNQWNDFNYKLPKGESLNEVQSRNIKALHKILDHYENETIVIGTHGTALSTILNYYNKNFDYYEFERIKSLMPFIVYCEFEGNKLLDYKEYIIS